MVNDAQKNTIPAPDESREPLLVPASLPDPDAVDDGDEEDGRL